jgi:hypothetical protein
MKEAGRRSPKVKEKKTESENIVSEREQVKGVRKGRMSEEKIFLQIVATVMPLFSRPPFKLFCVLRPHSRLQQNKAILPMVCDLRNF